MRNSPLWFTVLGLMNENPRRRGDVLPVMCKRHNRTTLMRYTEDWEKTDGGCGVPCESILECGHPCHLQCHPYSHEVVQCLKECGKTMACGHGCSGKCGETCLCSCEEFTKIKQAELTKGTSGAWADKNEDIRGPNLDGQNLPAYGSASCLPEQDFTIDKEKWQVRPSLDWGPADEATASTDPRSAKTGYRTGGAWNPNPKDTIRANRLSPANQGQRQKGWQEYAQGGVVADDERIHMTPTPVRTPLPNSAYKTQSISQGPSIIKETVMANGRTMYVEENQPGRGQLPSGQKIVTIPGNIPNMGRDERPHLNEADRNDSPTVVRGGGVTQPPADSASTTSKTGKGNENSTINDLKDLELW